VPSPKDARDGIVETLRQMTEIMSRGGGVGINISTLRPRHAYVKGVNGRSSGSVSWGALYSFVTGLIEQGGSRRGALMLILNDWHPDIFDFINSKRKMGQITNANISVGVSDKLMEAVKADGDWDLVFPDTTYPDYTLAWDGDLDKWIAAGRRVVKHRTVKAREVWDAIIESAWASAEPGVWFNERANKMSNSYYFNPLICTNPCGEQSIGAWSVCNLGAINLAKFYDESTNDVAWDDLKNAAAYGAHFLDNVIDATPYFFEENRERQMTERRVGLGIMGLAELMIQLGVRYGSDEGVAFTEKLFKFLTEHSYLESSRIAAEKGAFSEYDKRFLESGFMQRVKDELPHVYETIEKQGMRNVTVLTVAPTGTTGTMVNTSTGIEPFFSWVYYRKSRLGLHEEQVPLVKEWHAKNPGVEHLPDYFVAAMDLEPEEHVRMQAAAQKWVDSSISKTANLPNSYTVEQVSDLYQYMYEQGCKGGTIYRDGSRTEQVLMLKGDERAEKEMDSKSKVRETEKVEQTATPHRVYPRPEKLSGATVKCTTPFGTAYVTMNSDENGYPFEVFITSPGKAGSDLQADSEGLGRMVSLALRTTAPQNRLDMLRLVIEQLKDIGGTSRVGFGPSRVNSLPDALANVLQNHYFSENAPLQMALPMNGTPKIESAPAPVSEKPKNGNGKKPSYDICPSCGNAALIHADGCSSCTACGYSKC
jgi:ribonucleoside-diphosphate reductase alpha chain